MGKYDLIKFKNGKYYSGTMNDFPEFKGWFVGSFFDPDHPCHTSQIEICYHKREAGFKIAPHYHEQKIEVIIILEGLARYKINDKEILMKTGDFLFADVRNVIGGEFLEDTTVIAIHSPSIVTDKKVLLHRN